MSFRVSVHTCKKYLSICLRAYKRKCESVELKIFWRSLRAYARMKIFYRSQHAYVSNEDFSEVITRTRENKGFTDFLPVTTRISERLTFANILLYIEPKSNESDDLKENPTKPHIFNSFEPFKMLIFIAVFLIGCKVL